MKSVKVTMVRIYITEASKLLKPIMKYLHDETKVRGVSVFRAISGFGDSGETHDSGLVSLSLNLPLVIEFFDYPDKVSEVLKYISTIIKPAHVVFWDALANEKE
jgi:uncharacterized protein